MFVIRPSRGSDVVRETLGDNWDGVIVSDGWSAYSRYTVQRCTAHLIREIRTLANKYPDSKDATRAYRTFQKIIFDAKQKTSVQKRAALHKSVTNRVKKLIEKYQNNELLEKCMGKFGRALPDMFRFVLDPRIPPDNNPAEKMLRELVVHRKVRGSIRSEDAMELMGYIFTCATTWKNQEMDYVAELAKYA